MQKYLKVPWYSPFSDLFSSQLQWSSFAWLIIHETAQGKKNARFLAFCWNWCCLEASNNFVRGQKQGMTSHNQRLAGGEAWLRNLCPVRHYKRSNFQKSVLWRRHSESRPKKRWSFLIAGDLPDRVEMHSVGRKQWWSEFDIKLEHGKWVMSSNLLSNCKSNTKMCS